MLSKHIFLRCKKLSIALIFIVSLIIVLEIILRSFLGLGYPPLFQEHDTIGYCYQPNQSIYRFGKRIYYNQFHQRSELLQSHSNPRILMIGDSITNGGNSCDQFETISEQLETLLQNNGYPNAEVLNASAGGWAIENEWEYLQTFGTFDSQWIILNINDDDLLQPKSMHTILNTPHYPTQNFPTAYHEIWKRWIFPQETKPSSNSLNPSEQVKKNLELLLQMAIYIHNQNIPFTIVRIPKRSEVEPNCASHTNKPWKTCQTFLQNHSIETLDLVQAQCLLPTDFQDTIHLLPPANKKIAQEIFKHWKGKRK